MKAKKLSKTATWILMGLLILGLGGFGVTNLSGSVRSVGHVGDAEIDINEYARALQNEIRALEAERGSPVSFAQAKAAGIDQQVLSRLVSAAALDDETARLGLSVGDRNLREQILEIPGFRGMDGEFDREAYTYALEQAGLTEAKFESDMRKEAARRLVQDAVVSGVGAPAPYTDTLLDYISESRDVTLATLGRADLSGGLPDPSTEDLRSYYQSHLPDFTTPETRQITYAWLTPDMVLDEVELDEDTLRAAYDDHSERFNQPERRLVERLAFSDAATARAAREEIAAGNRSFEDYVSDRGLELSDIDMGDVTAGELGEAGADVFKAEAGEIVGPLDSPVGPALFRVNAVLAAQETSFEDAKPELREELAADRARRIVDSRIDGIDDLLAGGATLEQVADETALELGSIDWYPGMNDGIAAYAGFRDAAAELEEDDFPEVISFEEGPIVAMRLDAVKEPAVQPFEKVEDAVRAAWRAEAVTKALRAEVADKVTALENGESFEAAGLDGKSVTDITRRGFQPGTPPEFIETVFGMSEGEATVIDGDERIFVLRLERVTPPDPKDDELAELRTALAEQAANGIAQDLYRALAGDIRSRVGISLDTQALNAVHSSFQ
ncbi:peptidylprolyl isomerase [Roseovarius spongiae]|uniref:Parvulin-like PPIase n=1 Tax=Roseovarius spongiae TaxID=2320272 RepID=A0A3A8AY34_9RHOB|nr:peptidyl-prolyl cis-trans isomerase [Roseovarius spongiae]RKF15101.1 peptidylprolyl isomerase [Roseovarius spongiae]